MPTAWQGTPAGPALARATSIPGGERGGNGRGGGRKDTERRSKNPLTEQLRPRIGSEDDTKFWA